MSKELELLPVLFLLQLLLHAPHSPLWKVVLMKAIPCNYPEEEDPLIMKVGVCTDSGAEAMRVKTLKAAPSWSLSWCVQKYVSWILRIRVQGTEIGCCPSDEVLKKKRQSAHGTRIRLWPPSRAEPIDPNDASNRVIMEVVSCVYTEKEDQSVKKVDPTDQENFTLNTLRDHLHQHRRSEDPIKCPSWNIHRQWDWSSDEEDFEGHSVTITALVHAEAHFSDSEAEETGPAIRPGHMWTVVVFHYDKFLCSFFTLFLSTSPVSLSVFGAADGTQVLVHVCALSLSSRPSPYGF